MHTAGMSQHLQDFHFPTTAELDEYTAQRKSTPQHESDSAWVPPCLQAQIREAPWLDAGEALARSAFTDPISIMITFLRIED